MTIRIAAIIIILKVFVAYPVPCQAEPVSSNLGIILPLTGQLSEYGVAAKNGMEMARSEFPDLFKEIKFIYEDSQWDAKSAVTAFHRLRVEQKPFLIYNWGNPTTAAIAPLAEHYQVPLIGMAVDASVVNGRKYVIRGTNPPAAFTQALAAHFQQKNIRKIGVIITDFSYTRNLYENLLKQLGPDQSIEIVSAHTFTDADFRTPLLKIRQKKYDALGVFLVTGQISLFYRQLSKFGLQGLPTFGTDFFESSTEIKDAEGGMEDAVYPHLRTESEFAQRYLARFGNDYQLAYAANAHDMALLIGSLFSHDEVERALPEQVMRVLKSSRATGAGAGGRFRYVETLAGDKYYEFPVALKIVHGNGFQLLTR